MDGIKILLTVLLPASLTGAGVAAPSLSNSGGGSWQYYKEITVKENSGSALSAYQVLVQLSSSNFPTSARTDGADLRFTDAGGEVLSYWIEGWDYVNRNASVWMKAAEASTMRMCYVNPCAASSSNGDGLFQRVRLW